MLTVITPATNTRLTTAENVRAEYPSITVEAASDGQVERWIDRASVMVAEYCNRVFAREVVKQTEWPCGTSRIVLDRTPASALSVTVDGVVLVAGTDYHHDTQRGALYRLSAVRPSVWSGTVVIDYTAGYVLPGDEGANLPGAVEAAALLWVSGFASSQSTTTNSGIIKRESILNGLVDITYADATTSGVTTTQARPEIADLLAPYRRISL